MIQKALGVIDIFQNGAIDPSCNLRETRVARPGILVVRVEVETELAEVDDDGF